MLTDSPAPLWRRSLSLAVRPAGAWLEEAWHWLGRRLCGLLGSPRARPLCPAFLRLLPSRHVQSSSRGPSRTLPGRPALPSCAPLRPPRTPGLLGFGLLLPGRLHPRRTGRGSQGREGGSDSPCLTSSTGWGLSGCLCGLAELRSAGCSPTKPPSDTAHGLRQSAAEGEATLWVRKPRAVCSLLRGPMLACQRPHSVQGFGLLTGLGRSLISGAVTSGHNKQRA